MKSTEQMIEELQAVGIEIQYIPKAIVSGNHPQAIIEMDIASAYHKYCEGPIIPANCFGRMNIAAHPLKHGLQ